MPVSRFEIQSQEAQEVMKTPPHSLITWGNTIILIVLVVGFVMLNKVKLPIYTNFPVQIVGKPERADTGYTVELMMQGHLDNKVQKGQYCTVVADKANGDNTEKDGFRVVDIKLVTGDRATVFIRAENVAAQQQISLLANGSAATLKVHTSSESLFSLFSK